MRWITTIFCCCAVVFGSSLLAETIDSQDKPVVDFTLTHDLALKVAIRTERLLLRSLEPYDLESIIALFGDARVMEKYATGTTRTPEQVTERFNILSQRWQTTDPYSGLAVTLIDPALSPDEYPFLGMVILGHGDEPGVSELAYLFHQHHWNQGYGKEAVTAVIHNYASLLCQKGYRLEDTPLRQIVATSRVDNIASNEILEAAGMKRIGTSEKYGHERYHYAIDANQL